jgi:hypothetical protein
MSLPLEAQATIEDLYAEFHGHLDSGNVAGAKQVIKGAMYLEFYQAAKDMTEELMETICQDCEGAGVVEQGTKPDNKVPVTCLCKLQ